jgi:hypothetical protein
MTCMKLHYVFEEILVIEENWKAKEFSFDSSRPSEDSVFIVMLSIQQKTLPLFRVKRNGSSFLK